MRSWSISYFNTRIQRQIESWPAGIYADFLRLAQLIERYGIDLRMPQSRALYCFVSDREVVILHGFVKKTQKSPGKDINVARARIRQVKARG